MQQYGRISLALAAILLAVGLQGCFFPPANAVRGATLPKPGSKPVTRLVYGLDGSNGPISVALARYHPVTKEAGNCGRFDRTEASASVSGTNYFVFDAPPGIYIPSFYGTSGFVWESGPSAFVIPAGQITYVGDFGTAESSSSPSELLRTAGYLNRDDLEQAKATLGREAEPMTLAEVYQGVVQPRAFLCSP